MQFLPMLCELTRHFFLILFFFLNKGERGEMKEQNRREEVEKEGASEKEDLQRGGLAFASLAETKDLD